MNDTSKTNADSGEKPVLGRGAALQKQRQARQAESLRDNLKRRKQQVRSRDSGDGDEKSDV